MSLVLCAWNEDSCVSVAIAFGSGGMRSNMFVVCIPLQFCTTLGCFMTIASVNISFCANNEIFVAQLFVLLLIGKNISFIAVLFRYSLVGVAVVVVNRDA